MTLSIELRLLPERRYAGIRRRVPPAGIGAALGEILPAVGEWLAARGLAPAGPPATFYHAHDEAAGEFDLSGGFFVDAPVEGEGPIQTGTIPAGEAAHAMHVGPYETLGRTHAAIAAWIRAQGREPAESPCWELYWTDPGEIPDPAAWRTEVVHPVRPR